MLSHLLVHLPPLRWRSRIALFSMPHLISGINFHFHFVNQFHLFMLTSINPSVLHFPHPSPLHSFTLNSKLTFSVNPFYHRSLTIDTPDWLPLRRLMGPFSVSTLLIGFYRATACNATHGITVAILSVHPFACQMRLLWQNEIIICQFLNTIRSSNISSLSIPHLVQQMFSYNYSYEQSCTKHELFKNYSRQCIK